MIDIHSNIKLDTIDKLISLRIENEGSIKEFLALFARQYFRVSSLTTELEISENIINGVKTAQEYLDEIKGLSEEEIEKRASEYNATILGDDYIENTPEAIEANEKRAEKYIDMQELIYTFIDNVGNGWGDDVIYLLEDAQSYCYQQSFPHHEPPMEIKSFKEWHKGQIELATQTLKNQTCRLEREKLIIEEKNSLIKSFVELLEQE